MSASVQTRMERLEALYRPQGEIIVIAWHPCQAEAAVAALARRQLRRAWRPADMLVMIEQTDGCPQGPHVHEGRILCHPRVD
jgi:hypothetical protein